MNRKHPGPTIVILKWPIPLRNHDTHQRSYLLLWVMLGLSYILLYSAYIKKYLYLKENHNIHWCTISYDLLPFTIEWMFLGNSYIKCQSQIAHSTPKNLCSETPPLTLSLSNYWTRRTSRRWTKAVHKDW